MNTTKRTRNSWGLFVIMVLSSAMMLWLYWHFPLATALVTIGVLAALGVSARLARWVEVDGADLERHEQRA